MAFSLKGDIKQYDRLLQLHNKILNKIYIVLGEARAGMLDRARKDNRLTANLTSSLAYATGHFKDSKEIMKYLAKIINETDLFLNELKEEAQKRGTWVEKELLDQYLVVLEQVQERGHRIIARLQAKKS